MPSDTERTGTLTKADLERAARDAQVPAHLIEGLCAYAVDHRETGGFLEAVLSNDLSCALQRADRKSLAGLIPIVHFVVRHLPSECHGSRAKVHEWLHPTR